MLYMSEFFQEKLRLPVSYLNTFSLVAIGEEIDKERLQNMAPMCQELIGTALHSIGSCPINITLLPKMIRKQYELNVRKPYFYASAGVLLACLLLFGFGVDQLLHREQNRVARARTEVDRIEKISKEIDGLHGKFTAAEGRFNEFKRVFDSRTGKAKDSYFAVLAELQRIIPDQMWLVSIEPYDTNPPQPKSGAAVRSAEEAEYSGEEQNTAAVVDNSTKDQREVKFLLLKGYTISVKNTLEPVKGSPVHENYLRKFRENLKNSAVFKEESRLDKNTESGNLTSFEIVLELKETIRK